MSNHCAECEICGDCLRGCGQARACGWRDCPGYISRAENLLMIAAMHPLPARRSKALEILEGLREEHQAINDQPQR
jgi:hypothetical protein